MDRREFLKTSIYGIGLLSFPISVAGENKFSGHNFPDEKNIINHTLPEINKIRDDIIIRFDSSGNRLEALTGENKIRLISPEGSIIFETGEFGFGKGEFNRPVSICGNGEKRIFVIDGGSSRIQAFDYSGNFITEFGSSGLKHEKISRPGDILIKPHTSELYVSDAGNHRIAVFDFFGKYMRHFGSFGLYGKYLNYPRGLAFDSKENLHVIDAGNCKIKIFDPSGNYMGEYGKRGECEGEFLVPSSIAIDGQDNSFVADRGAPYISIFRNGTYISRILTDNSRHKRLCSVMLALDGKNQLFITFS